MSQRNCSVVLVFHGTSASRIVIRDLTEIWPKVARITSQLSSALALTWYAVTAFIQPWPATALKLSGLIYL
jgi:hypothetical protein